MHSIKTVNYAETFTFPGWQRSLLLLLKSESYRMQTNVKTANFFPFCLCSLNAVVGCPSHSYFLIRDCTHWFS